MTGTELSPQDRQAIADVKYRYLRGVDAKDWDLLGATLMPDAVARYGGGVHVIEGRDGILEFLRTRLERDAVHTSHRVNHPLLEAAGEGAATGQWTLDDVVIDTEFRIHLVGAGWYQDRYVQTDGGWQIAETGYTRTYELLQPLAEDATLTASAWQTGGRTTLPY